MHIESPVFENHMPLPQKYTCQGEDVSPPIVFRDLPRGAKGIAFIMEDPDAPSGTFDHWIFWNLSPDTKTLNEGDKPPKEGTNSLLKIGYSGPCPPPGKAHRYFFKAYAIDVLLEIPEGSSKNQLLKAIEGHILGTSELMGTYQRQ